ncbi:MAG TPA: FHA domain-containing protein [Pirellulales bacterium]
MLVYVINGSLAGRKIFLASGQIARFGRTEWADYAFPQDPLMAPVHFSIRRASDGCHLTGLATPPGILVNGETVTGAVLIDGDEIVAGSTKFRVEQTGKQPAAATDGAPAAGPSVAMATPVVGSSDTQVEPTAKELAAYLGLDAAAKSLARDNQSPAELLAELSQPGSFPAALRVLAHLLPKRAAVWWCWLGIGHAGHVPLDAKELAAMAASRRWIAAPSDHLGREAFAAAQAAGLDSPGAWPGMAAFWSGSSLASPEFPAVPPDERLAGKGATAALLLTIGRMPPAEVEATFRAFLQLGTKLAAGPIDWPAADRT